MPNRFLRAFLRPGAKITNSAATIRRFSQEAKRFLENENRWQWFSNDSKKPVGSVNVNHNQYLQAASNFNIEAKEEGKMIPHEKDWIDVLSALAPVFISLGVAY